HSGTGRPRTWSMVWSWNFWVWCLASTLDGLPLGGELRMSSDAFSTVWSIHFPFRCKCGWSPSILMLLGFHLPVICHLAIGPDLSASPRLNCDTGYRALTAQGY